MIAYHFVNKTLRDGRTVPKDGEVLQHRGPLKPCNSGLHASIRPWDALRYAPGPILCQVKCGGKLVHDTDKLVCTRRTIIRRMDATELLRYFARMQAVSMLHRWQECPPDVVLDYLMTGDESLRDAAWAVAQAVAWDTAQAASWDAARDAAWAAVWVAARTAVGDAASREFDALVEECFA
jgi:hypothetical protein